MNNIYLFCGEDSFRAYEKLSKWREKFIEKYQDLNYQLFHGAEMSASDFENAATTFPFLSEKKLIVVMDFLKEGNEADQKRVAELLEKVSEENIVVFFEHGKPDGRTLLFKRLKKNGILEEFKLLGGFELEKWIAGRLGSRPGAPQVKVLSEYVGSNLWNANNEIEKLKLYANGSDVTIEMIEKMVSPNLTSTVFRLTDLLGEQKIVEALRVFKILMDSGQEPIGVLFMMVRHFRIMAQVKELSAEGMRESEIARRLKEHPFVIKKMIPQISRFDFAEIRRIYAGLASIDHGLKSGRIRVIAGDYSALEQEIEALMVLACHS
ncbi:DNA polymerase III subunit delta [Candidatus Peregrinibacteria bacterium]|nr:DNA polymerase III subunit delta [Candidatus Peregrinibacteria bacterium]